MIQLVNYLLTSYRINLINKKRMKVVLIIGGAVSGSTAAKN